MNLLNPLSWFKRGDAVRDFTDDRYFGGPTVVGRFIVNPETAMSASAVFPCVSLIADIIGSLPLEFPAVDVNGKAESDPFPRANRLSVAPNPLMTGAEFWSTVAFNAVLRGASYAEPVVMAGDMELWPLRPAGISEKHQERLFGLDYTYEDNRTRSFRAGELLRVSGISADGVYAVVPWKVARTAIEMANTLEEYGKSFFKNGARPSFALGADKGISDKAIARLKSEFQGNFAGALNAGKVPVLEEGLKPLPISLNNADSQLMELRRNQIREIARQWRIPLFMLGEEAPNKSSEQLAGDFVKYTLRPWLKRIEQAIARDLMTEEERGKWQPKFNLDALLRGDSATQHRNAVLARTSSTHSVNELRTKWFNLPRIEEDWADDPREPLNSNRAADQQEGGMTAPQDRSDANVTEPEKEAADA